MKDKSIHKSQEKMLFEMLLNRHHYQPLKR